MRKLLQIIVEKITGRTCKKCAWCDGCFCANSVEKYAECASSIYPKHFKKGGAE